VTRPPPLTDLQKRRLGELEPALRLASKRGDYSEARRLTQAIQGLLRKTGHETRLQQAKNWLFEAALEDGRIQTAISGFEGVRKKTNKRTRVYLEATALLAISYLRLRDFDSAKPLIAEAHARVNNINSDRRRRQFQRRLVDRFEVEWTIAVLADDAPSILDTDEVYADAGRLVQTTTGDELLKYMGESLRADQVDQILRVYEFSRKQLPSADRKLLPSPEDKRKRREVGSTLLASAKRVIWRSLCDPESDVYKMWFTNGLAKVTDYRVIAGAVSASLLSAKLTYLAIAAGATAMLVKMGVEVFCESFQPPSMMIGRSE